MRIGPSDDRRRPEAGARDDLPAAAGAADRRPGAARLRASRARRSPISTTRPTTTRRDAEAALEGSGISVPALEAYADKLWDYWERNLDPDLFKDRSLRGAIEGKVVVITGASSGIGHAVALKVGEAGGIAVLVARSVDKLEETKAAIEEAGGTATMHSADLSDLDDCDRVVEEILAEHGRVDILVNNAGRSIRRSIEHSVRPLPRLPAHDAAQLLRCAEADHRLPARHARAQVRSHHQRLVDRRADEHAALLRLCGEQERARRLLPLHRVGARRRPRGRHDHLHAAGAHADDRADRDVRRLPDGLARGGGRAGHRTR